MNNSKEQFLHRTLLYKLQYLAGGIMSIAIWYGVFVLFCYLEAFYGVSGKHHINLLLAAPVLIFSLFNTITYYYSSFLAKKYGIEMFADLDQEWLQEHQAFNSKAFGEYFSRLIQCRKIAGPYMLVVIVPIAFINMYLATGIGVVYLIAYYFYRNTYFDTAVSYKIPRALGGGGIVVSKIIDPEFTNKLDKLSNKLDPKDKK